LRNLPFFVRSDSLTIWETRVDGALFPAPFLIRRTSHGPLIILTVVCLVKPRISLNLKKPKKKAGGRRKKVTAPQVTPKVREEGDDEKGDDGEGDDYDDGEAERAAREAVRLCLPSKSLTLNSNFVRLVPL
jgi:hypothetical protein